MALLLQISSGRGPVECCRVVALMTEILFEDARKAGFDAELIESEPGAEKGTLLSALLHLDGTDVTQFAAGYAGTVQWIGNSTFRPGHKRKNWYIGIRQIVMPQLVTLEEKDIRIETMKGSGPGGQHVNTTESAVRVVHVPTGISAIGRDQRSQSANRKKALERLGILLTRHEQKSAAKNRKLRWDAHNELERGNPVRVYEGGRLIKGT